MTNCYTGRLGTCFDLITTANAGRCSLARSRCLFIFPVFAQKLNGPWWLLSGPGTRSSQFRMAERLFDFGHLISSDVHLFQNQINCNEATLCCTKCYKLFVPCATFVTGYCNTAKCLLHGIRRGETGNCAGWAVGCGMKVVVVVVEVVVVVVFHCFTVHFSIQ